MDGASVLTAVTGVLVAVIAGGVALVQTRRTRESEREKIPLQLAADLTRRAQELEQEQQAAERERGRLAEDAERERVRAAEEVAARRATALVSYCTRLAGELSTLRILDMSRPLHLDHLYVQVRVQEQRPLRFVRAEDVDQDRTQEAVRGDERADSSGAGHTYAPVDALQRYQRIVVVGDPGAGKTTMLRHLALRMARRTQDEALPELPAYVELFRFVESGHDDLLDYLSQHWADQYGFTDAREYVAEKLADGTAALLLDGLDEVLGGESAEAALGAYHRVTEEITRLAARYPRALIATTCRRHGWQGGLPQFQVLEALDFEWPQIETFIANWFGDRDRRRGGLVRALAGNARLQTLATNPLLLSLIAIVYERDLELPERRAALYRRCVEVLLREWDAHRKISRYSRFTTDRKQDLLKELACHYHERGMRYFPEEDLLDRIAAFLPTIDLPATDAPAILDEIAAQYGLLKAQAHGWYGFLHLTLQEHFTAAALLERGEEGIGRAVAARYDQWWEEVILLLAGSLGDATLLLLGVLQPEGREADSGLLRLPHDDLFHTDLLLAARCLAGSPRVADVALREQIVRTVWELLETSPYPSERQQAADAVVGFLGSDRQLNEVVAYIGDESKRLWSRVALVDALSAHGGRNVGERLLGVLSLTASRAAELRRHLIQAMGTLRVEAAVPRLSADLAHELADRPAPGPDHAEAMDIGSLLRSLGAAGAPADLLVRTLEDCAEWTSYEPLAQGVRDALVGVRDPGVADRLLALLRLDNGWFFEREHMAVAYLEVAGAPGAEVLLDIVRYSRATDYQKLPLMAALSGFTAEGHGWGYRDALLALAHDGTQIWQVRWLALECLDHSPGPLTDIQDLLDGTAPEVAVAAAATAAAWGTPVGLGDIRNAILTDVVPHSLAHTSELRGRRVWQGRIATRLAEVLVPYGNTDIVRRFVGMTRALPAAAYDARCWLYALAPDAGVDAFLEALESDSGTYASECPARIPASRVSVVLQRCLQVREESSGMSRQQLSRLLDAAGAIAEDTESIALLLPFLSPGGDPGSALYNRFHLVHGLVQRASRRAGIRVLPDRSLVRLPRPTPGGPPASSAPPPPGSGTRSPRSGPAA
ncbi:NACHT domain-containing protein [Streptomyces sp. NPDC086777]|uniref:NACHT domain-containing protein n=1 Tax=Streptomyces sp. NPDC086777 TaxID=3154866 RepID=UPI00344BC453